MTAAYATADQLGAFTSDDFDLDGDEASRILTRASELLDSKIRVPFSVDTETDLPTDTDIATALADACCAQVEFWVGVGEDHDVEGLAGRQVGIGHLSLSALPPELAPRAARILRVSGLTGVDEGSLVYR